MCSTLQMGWRMSPDDFVDSATAAEFLREAAGGRAIPADLDVLFAAMYPKDVYSFAEASLIKVSVDVVLSGWADTSVLFTCLLLLLHVWFTHALPLCRVS